MAKNGSPIATRLREARTRNGWTMVQVAGWAGLAEAQISRYEAGAMSPSAENLRKLAGALRVSSDWLLGLEDGP